MVVGIVYRKVKKLKKEMEKEKVERKRRGG
jgi:hypothetical protein